MKKEVIALVMVLFLFLISGCTKPEFKTDDPGTVFEGELIGEEIGSDTSNIDVGIDATDKDMIQTEELLFSEDFSSDLAAWTISMVPSVYDGALSSRSFSISTSSSFPSRNGIELSFDFHSGKSPTGGFNVKLIEKSYASNYASLVTDTSGNMMYWIEGHCITPTPKVQVMKSPEDDAVHRITFRAHTDGSAEWLMDGQVQFQRSSFDIAGDYTIMLSGSSMIGSKEDNVFLDNIQLMSLNEASPSSDICKEVPHTPAKNPCPYGRCLSNGFCCPSYIPYYCEGYCYTSSNAAMSKSQGRCVNFKIIC